MERDESCDDYDRYEFCPPNYDFESDEEFIDLDIPPENFVPNFVFSHSLPLELRPIFQEPVMPYALARQDFILSRKPYSEELQCESSNRDPLMADKFLNMLEDDEEFRNDVLRYELKPIGYQEYLEDDPVLADDVEEVSNRMTLRNEQRIGKFGPALVIVDDEHTLTHEDFKHLDVLKITPCVSLDAEMTAIADVRYLFEGEPQEATPDPVSCIEQLQSVLMTETQYAETIARLTKKYGHSRTLTAKFVELRVKSLVHGKTFYHFNDHEVWTDFDVGQTLKIMYVGENQRPPSLAEIAHRARTFRERENVPRVKIKR